REQWSSVGTDAPNGRGLRPGDPGVPTPKAGPGRYRRPEWKGIATHPSRLLLFRHHLRRYRRPEWKGIATPLPTLYMETYSGVGTDAPNGRGLRRWSCAAPESSGLRSVPTPRMEGDCDLGIQVCRHRRQVQVGTDAPNGRGLRRASRPASRPDQDGRYRRPEWKGIATS